MATKTISLEIDAYEKLRRSKLEGESFSAVVRRARFDPADARGSSIIGALATLTVRESDKKAVMHWEKAGLPERKVSGNIPIVTSRFPAACFPSVISLGSQA